MTAHESTYIVSNTTDLRDAPYTTTNERNARRMWNTVKPTRCAGNLYHASFVRVCEICDGHQDMTVDYVTCRCG